MHPKTKIKIRSYLIFQEWCRLYQLKVNKALRKNWNNQEQTDND